MCKHQTAHAIRKRNAKVPNSANGMIGPFVQSLAAMENGHDRDRAQLDAQTLMLIIPIIALLKRNFAINRHVGST